MLLHHKALLFFSAGVLVLALMCIRPANASFVFASSDMALFDLRFSSPDPAAELIWTDEWFGQVTAHAQDTNSGSADASLGLLGNDVSIVAEASTAHVFSQATYEVINGEFVAIDPSGFIDTTTHSDLEITEKDKQADGFAIGNFDNFFAVIGGDPGDPVEVTFELDYVGQLIGIAEQGSFEVALAGLLTLFDTTTDSLLAFDLVLVSASGTNTVFAPPAYAGTLSVTSQLFYGEEYWLFAEADSEIYGVVPEPASLLLMLLGVGLLVAQRRNMSRARH